MAIQSKNAVQWRVQDPDRAYPLSGSVWEVCRDEVGVQLKSRISKQRKYTFTVGLLFVLFGCCSVSLGIWFEQTAMGLGFLLAAGVAAVGFLGVQYASFYAIRKSPETVLTVRGDGACELFDGQVCIEASSTKSLQCFIANQGISSSGNPSSSGFSELNLLVGAGDEAEVFRLIASRDDHCLHMAKKLAKLTGWSRETKWFLIPEIGNQP